MPVDSFWKDSWILSVKLALEFCNSWCLWSFTYWFNSFQRVILDTLLSYIQFSHKCFAIALFLSVLISCWSCPSKSTIVSWFEVDFLWSPSWWPLFTHHLFEISSFSGLGFLSSTHPPTGCFLGLKGNRYLSW